jgi:uncharacterized protein (TIGR02271 family)
MAYDTSGGPGDYRQIREGWDVYGPDHEKIGEVARIYSTYLVISSGFLFPSERYVPFTTVSGFEEDRVYLSVTSDEIDARGWDSPEAVQASEADYRATTPTRDAGERPVDDTEHMELREEELRVRKESVEAGSVDVGKDVIVERESMDVPLRREEVDIHYRPAEGHQRAEGQIGDDEEIHIPVREERVRAEKETVVSGEVDINKREVEDTEHISEEVRKERLRVEREGDVDFRDTEPDEPRRP